MIDSDLFRLEILKRIDALHRVASRVDLEGLDRMGRDKVHKEMQQIIDSLGALNDQLLETAE